MGAEKTENVEKIEPATLFRRPAKSTPNINFLCNRKPVLPTPPSYSRILSPHFHPPTYNIKSDDV